MTDDKLRAAVERIFDDYRFHKISNSIWLYSGEIDGVRVGLIEAATYNSSFGNFSLIVPSSDAGSTPRAVAASARSMWPRADTTHRTTRSVSSRLSRPLRWLRRCATRSPARGQTWSILDFGRLGRRGLDVT